jgi:predicted DNA-binding antitoxin AbrB/MazE fold protein
MTIMVTAVYEGGGVLKLEKPIDLKEKSKVHVIIETEPEAASAVEDDDATGRKADGPSPRRGMHHRAGNDRPRALSAGGDLQR